MKKMLYLLLTMVCLFLIYNLFRNNGIHLVYISNDIKSYDNYIKEYLDKPIYFNNVFKEKTILRLVNDIKNNRTIWDDNNEIYLKKVLRESDVLVINIGMYELNNYYNPYRMDLNRYYFNNMYQSIEELICEIVKYAKEKIIFIGYFNPTEYYDGKTDEFFYYVNSKLNRLMINNNIAYIDVYKLFKENNYKSNEIINQNGYKALASIIAFYL